MTAPMPLDLQSFLDTMFTNQRVSMLELVTKPEAPASSFLRGEDGVWTLTLRGKCLGWVNKVEDKEKPFRALSDVTHTIGRFYSLTSAREFLFEQSI